MNTTQKFPIHREDDNELLGFVVGNGASWEARTIFGYAIERTADRASAERIVREEGLVSLMGVWHYYDRDDQQWHPCILKEAYESRVVVVRTNQMGYQDPDDYKRVVITNPADTNLIKG